MRPETPKQVGKWGRDLIISVIIVPAILSLLQMNPLVVAVGGAFCLFVLVSWENWGWISQRFIRKAPVAVGLLAITLSIVGFYYSRYSTTPFWVSSDLPIVLPPRPTPAASGVTLPQSLPLQSRLERFIFACDVSPPQNDGEADAQKLRLEKNIKVWADSLGVDVSFADLDNGMRATAEAKTPEARVRFLTLGIMVGIIKLIAELRRNGAQQIVVVRAEIPKKLLFIYGLTPDPNDPHIIQGKQLLEQFLDVKEDACRLI
jgi:hypothetical protein